MREIKLGARLSAYSKVDAVSCTGANIEEMTSCDVDKLFGDICEECTEIVSKPNEVTCSDIDALFK